MAATGAPAVVAVTTNPSGASLTESPWDIHTDCSGGSCANSADDEAVIDSGVRPNSLKPVRSTRPPRARAMAWNP